MVDRGRGGERERGCTGRIRHASPAPRGPRFGFQKVPDPTPGKNKVHLDFHAADKEAEVARLVASGAEERGGTASGRTSTGWCSPTRRATRSASPGADPAGTIRAALLSVIAFAIDTRRAGRCSRSVWSGGASPRPWCSSWPAFAVGFTTSGCTRRHAQRRDRPARGRSSSGRSCCSSMPPTYAVGCSAGTRALAMRMLFISDAAQHRAVRRDSGLWLLPGPRNTWAGGCMVIACVVVPTDFAPVASILR